MADRISAVPGLPRWHPNPIVRASIARIREHGWAVTAVSDECMFDTDECDAPECAFAYTSGLTLHAIPELAVYGLDPRTSTRVINELGRVLYRYDWRQLIDVHCEIQLDALDMPIVLIELIDESDLRVTAELFPDSPALQVVWPDDLGSYPWEAGYTLCSHHQPVKGVPVSTSGRVVGPRTISRSDGPNRSERRRAQRRRPRE